MIYLANSKDWFPIVSGASKQTKFLCSLVGSGGTEGHLDVVQRFLVNYGTWNTQVPPVFYQKDIIVQNLLKGAEWERIRDKLKLLLVIYVDDLKLAGPNENLAKGWEMLRTVLRIEPETDLGLYLGCVLSQGEAQLHNGKKVKTITYNMEGLLKLSVEKYLDIVGKDTNLKKVSAPSLPEETTSSQYRAPSDGKHRVECPWCAHSFDPAMPVLSETGSSPPGQESESLNRANLAPHAASVLMQPALRGSIFYDPSMLWHEM